VLAHSVGEPITLFSVARTPEDESVAEDNVKNARALLKAIGIKVKDTRIAIGDPAAQIIEHGSEHQIIVVSDEGRSRLQRAIRGSTAYSVVRGARTSVLDVR
jgi:nucleotide-binding universal stress UspA family protein